MKNRLTALVSALRSEFARFEAAEVVLIDDMSEIDP